MEVTDNIKRFLRKKKESNLWTIFYPISIPIAAVTVDKQFLNCLKIYVPLAILVLSSNKNSNLWRFPMISIYVWYMAIDWNDLWKHECMGGQKSVNW